MKATFLLAASGLFLACVSCERHSWDEVKVLHEPHGHHSGGHAEGHGEHAEGAAGHGEGHDAKAEGHDAGKAEGAH